MSSLLAKVPASPHLHAFLVFFLVWILSQALEPRFSLEYALLRSVVLQVVLVLGLPVAAVCVGQLPMRQVFKIQLPSSRHVLLTLVATPCLMVLLDEIQFLQSHWMGSDSNSVELFLHAGSVGRWLQLILFIAIIPAFCEETMFRGYLLDRLSARGHSWPAIMVSSVLFGVFHQSIHTLIPAALFGVFFAFLTMRTESLINSIISHFMVNIWAIVVVNSKVSSMFHWLQGNEHVPLWLLAGCLTGIVLTGRILSK